MAFGGRGNKRHMFSGAARPQPGVMNKTEAAFDRDVLAPAKERGEILWYKFEAIRLVLAGKRRATLTVDFAVIRSDGLLEFIDVKGSPRIFSDDAKVKMRVAAETFPFIFSVAFPRAKKDGGGWLIEEI